MTVEDIARLLKGKVQGEPTHAIRGVAQLETAGPEELAYAEGERALATAAKSRAGCILVAEGVSLRGQTTIVVGHPKLAFIRAVEVLLPATVPAPGIHPTAVIAPDAQLASGVSVGPHVVIERGVRVDEGTRLGAGVFLGEGVRVGAGCTLYPRV